MNPYLEKSDAWEDFHHDFITLARQMLVGQVGENYIVKVEVRIYLHELSESERRFFGRADLGVSALAPEQSAAVMGGGVMAAPVQLMLPTTELAREAWIEIRDRHNRRVITVIELLSPSNKSGADRQAYLAKRKEILAGRAHFVEIDLLRAGERPQLPELPPCDYYALVSRSQNRPAVDMWPIGLRQPLPCLPIPLTPPDKDIALDLQALVHRVHDDADFRKYIYAEPPEPPLSADDAAWARQYLP
jgi:hypothetical protein